MDCGTGVEAKKHYEYGGPQIMYTSIKLGFQLVLDNNVFLATGEECDKKTFAKMSRIINSKH